MDKTRLDEERDDIYNEMSGREVGRIKRLHRPHELNNPEKEEAETNIALAMADLLEAEEVRRAEFQQRMKELNGRYECLSEASKKALADAEQDLEELQSRANRAKDGRRVYLNEDDGAIYDESGKLVSPEDVDLDSWDKDAPSYSKYKGAEAHYRDAKERAREVEQIGRDLKNVNTPEEVDAIERRVTEAEGEYAPESEQVVGANYYDYSEVQSGQQKGPFLSIYKWRRFDKSNVGECVGQKMVRLG